MKNVTITGIMVSMLMTTGVAFAAGEADAVLTTKNYVDAGLRAVYRTASDAASSAAINAGNIETLQTAVNSNAGNIEALQSAVDSNASDIEALQSAVNNLDSSAYSGVNGVTISDRNVSLDVDATEGNMYVYTSSGWSELDIVDTWNSSVLNSGL